MATSTTRNNYERLSYELIQTHYPQISILQLAKICGLIYSFYLLDVDHRDAVNWTLDSLR